MWVTLVLRRVSEMKTNKSPSSPIIWKIDDIYRHISFVLFSATTADRFFRIDRSQEHLHYITDISSDDLYVLDPERTKPSPLASDQKAGSMPDLLAQEGSHRVPPHLILGNSLPIPTSGQLLQSRRYVVVVINHVFVSVASIGSKKIFKCLLELEVN